MIYLRLDEKGMSLIEVIISIAILGILTVPICGLLNINISSNRESKIQIIATNLAESKIEELKFITPIKAGTHSTFEHGFIIESSVEAVDRKDISTEEKQSMLFNDLYRIIVEVKKDDRVIEKLFTYSSSLQEDS